ncbi:RnfABCDGE type electron transport complex subunit B [Alloiococcus sp. CFN-8]|uniref:RnfABCDGE type electron transport complex subunit B n=1 Tax=Alloiococcus sp. CFN-8 TaxID=3416081 RepID=UPI003CF5E52D
MDIQIILIAAAIVGGTGLFIGLFLGVAGEKFNVEVDEKELAIAAVLPGNNCGGCGYAGCDALAKAIANGEAPAGACPVGGAPVAAKISDILGVETEEYKHMVAFVKCGGGCSKTKQNYNYYGVEDCKFLEFVPSGGAKACNYGCTGFGSCKKVCEFGAIDIVDGIAVIDKERCKACGKCVLECPKSLIEFVPYEARYIVQCSSKDFGKAVKTSCSVGCIGCKLCTRVCEVDAITVENNIAYIDQKKCIGCGKCAEKCPSKIIKNNI